MQTSGARGRRGRGETENGGPALPDDLTADIDDELDAELFATASRVGAAEAEPPAAVVQTGDLAATDGAVLLGRAFQEVWTGQLLFRSKDLEKSIFFEAGRPVYALSTALEDRLGEILVRQGRLDGQQRTRVARISAETGRRTGAVLVDLGLLKPGELLPALRGQHEEIILSIVPWAEGRYRFDPQVEPDPRKIRLLRHPAVLLREALGRGYPEPRLRQNLGSGRTALLAALGPEAEDVLAELALTPEERAVLAWFDGLRSLDEVARVSGQDAERVATLVFPLRCFGVLAPASSGGRGRRSFDQKVDRARILSRHALLQDADYFQILGIGRDASAPEVARAYRRLSEEIGPQRVSPQVAVELAHELETVRGVLHEAARVLSDETLRGRYREHLLPLVGRRS